MLILTDLCIRCCHPLHHHLPCLTVCIFSLLSQALLQLIFTFLIFAWIISTIITTTITVTVIHCPIICAPETTSATGVNPPPCPNCSSISSDFSFSTTSMLIAAETMMRFLRCFVSSWDSVQILCTFHVRSHASCVFHH